MADIRIKIAKDKAKLVKALRAGEGSTGPFQTYADVVTFGAVYGFKQKRRTSFELSSRKDSDPIPITQFKKQEVLSLIAIVASHDPKVLRDDDDSIQAKVRIFEEYANGGFEILESRLNGVENISTQILLSMRATENISSQVDFDVLDFL
ncbi:MAG: DNA phosphorothioation-associated protein 4 [Leptolyngbya sp. SIO1D8]|nr:DNA phosphorothioation-associated protein 4 [Leptolyngbya sp. SIO1D8]